MFVLLETGMPLQSNDEVFICEDDYVSWDDAISHYGNVVYSEENMMPVRRKISGALELAQQHLTGDKTAEALPRGDITPSCSTCIHDCTGNEACLTCNNFCNHTPA